jgi:hypothetical protein
MNLGEEANAPQESRLDPDEQLKEAFLMRIYVNVSRQSLSKIKSQHIELQTGFG